MHPESTRMETPNQASSSKDRQQRAVARSQTVPARKPKPFTLSLDTSTLTSNRGSEQQELPSTFLFPFSKDNTRTDRLEVMPSMSQKTGRDLLEAGGKDEFVAAWVKTQARNPGRSFGPRHSTSMRKAPELVRGDSVAVASTSRSNHARTPARSKTMSATEGNNALEPRRRRTTSASLPPLPTSANPSESPSKGDGKRFSTLFRRVTRLLGRN